MDSSITIYLSALALGAVHALEVDHMVAVGSLAGLRPKISAAFVLGLRWGLGHAAVVLALGAVLFWLGLKIPASYQAWSEAGVGAALVVLGIWTYRRASRLHIHRPEDHGGHAHLHAHLRGRAQHEHHHEDGRHRRHQHTSTFLGAVHGVAGTAPVIALIPVTMISQATAAMAYLGTFGLGAMLAMGCYSATAAALVSRVASSVRTLSVVTRAMGAITTALGVYWILRSLP